MRSYACRQTSALIDRLAARVESAAQAAEAEPIHDLRVSIRRLRRCLRVFSQFYPPGSWKKIRKQLSELMTVAGSVRDRDIALELLQGSGVKPEAAIMRKIAAERRRAERHLVAEVLRWKESGFSHKWKSRLEL
jgi:CHAD domain-containing protein